MFFISTFRRRLCSCHKVLRVSGIHLFISIFQVQCFSEEDWNNLAEKFENCASKLERSLLQTLREDFLPEIPRLFQEKEKVKQKVLTYEDRIKVWPELSSPLPECVEL